MHIDIVPFEDYNKSRFSIDCTKKDRVLGRYLMSGNKMMEASWGLMLCDAFLF